MNETHYDIIVKEISKKFNSINVLNDVHFKVKKGEFFGVLGVNGAGKTTLINILMGMLVPTFGEIQLLGQDLFKNRDKLYPRINFSSAYVKLPYNLRVRRNLDFFAELYDVDNQKEKIDELLELFELGSFQNKMTGALSSGEQTRLNLCKSLLNDPKVLFLDEPTSSLDPDVSDKIKTILKTYQKKTNATVIYTSHNMVEVEELCDRLIFLDHGKLIFEGEVHDIKRQFETDKLEDVFIQIARQKKEVS